LLSLVYPFCCHVDIESGWPASGETIGAAVPGEENKYIAINAIIEATGGDCIVFEAFPDLWKPVGPNGVETSFVIPGLTVLTLGIVYKFVVRGVIYWSAFAVGYISLHKIVG
jgi:hypothetical protein